MSSTKLVKKNLFTKPYLLTLDEVSEIGQNMNLVGYDPQLNITSDDTNIVLKYGVASSPKILNYIDSYKIAGIDYTLFYTEVNSGLNIGDRVFIINGTYDSNLLIQTDKYKKGHDGYKVLFIDNCKVVLDIEFTGSLPSNETTENNDDFDDFIKVYYLKDQNDFIHVNRQITTRVSNGKVDFKFNRNQNNIVFASSNFSTITDNWGRNDGLLGAPGFFIKNATASWIDISSDFMTGSYSIAATSSNNKILILNNSFTYNDFEFKENSVYSWEYDTIAATYSWLVNVKHENNNVPILTKSNFRNGSFNGTWNGGLYGSNDKRITWGSTTSFWNHGTLLNTIWEKGIMESKYSQTESYIAEFDKYGLPYQKSTNPDNDGYGYNFVINSEIRNAVINNANVSNSILLGTGTATNISIVEDHVKGNLTDQYIRDNFNSTLINKAYFESCGIQNANIENAIIKNSRVSNSRIYSVKSINTHYKSSLFKNSNYISDNIIKVLDFDEFEYSDSSNTTHLIYKFYINKRSYEKFKFKDNFYIKGIKLNYSVANATFLETAPNINSILNFFDKKFKIGPWKEYVDVYDSNTFSKAPIQFNSFVSTTKENQYKHDVYNTSIVNQTTDENSKGYSLDIFIKLDSSFNPIINQNSVSYKDVIDFSNAYIQNSDFESGIVENSNWNSGSHINYNDKLNLVNSLNNDGEYDISLTQSTSLILNNINLGGVITPNDEFDLDYLNVNDIIFLNALDYDSRGIVTSTTVTQSGAGYLTSNGITASYTGNGTGLSLNIVTSTIGGVLNPITYNGDGNGYGYSGLYSTYNISGSGLGSGLILNIIKNTLDSTLSSFTIDSIGQGYQIGDIVGVTTNGTPGTFRVDNVSNGEVISTSVSTGGLFYELGDVLNIETGNGLAKIQVTGITGSLTRLPDTYKVLNLAPFIVSEIVATGSTGILPGLTSSGKFSSYGANNRYGYLHKTKFYKSKIVSGLFRRAYIKGSLIKNDSIDISDKDFINVEKLKSLMIVDSIFSKNDNILSNALYTFSTFVNGTDIWDNGILFRSIWNGMKFNNGLIKESAWLDGTFLNGLFYMSSLPSINVPFYNSNNVRSYYKSGSLLTDDNNDRFSWRKGTFVNGEFYKSKWEDGYFNGGKFYYSDFYNGEINGGIIGDKSISVSDTKIYNGTINYTTVENADLTANYTDTNNSVYNNINWYDGVFNGGIFNTYGTNSATWYNGTFNGGEFGPFNAASSNTNIPKWKNGIFNGGKFTSIYGTSSGTSSNSNVLDDITSYSWENGTFNGGEFGNANINSYYNSSWFNGIFNGGKFIGKVWNSGIFTFGEFSGSGKTQSGFYAIGGTASSVDSNANKFVKSFDDNNYYGLWRSGFVSDTKNRYLDQEIFTDLQRSSDINRTLPFTLLKDMLWLSGTFSHPSATIQNSVWLDGTFENGTFKSSAFNPYVSRNNTNQTFNFSDTCRWTNGLFDSGEFSISKWDNGKFITGTATGMIWKNGIVNYMNAYNVFWEDGLWRNGNWEGSYYNINSDGSVTDPYVKQILNRGMSWSGTSSCHIWSVFYKESLTQFSDNIIQPIVAGEVVYQVDILLENQVPLPPTQFGVVEAGSTPGNTSNKVLGKIEWTIPASSGIMSLNSDLSPNVVDNNSIESGFGFDGPVFVIKKQISSGKYICAGGFTSYKGIAVKSICRLNTDFTLDTTFIPPNYTSYIYNIEIDSSDRIYVASFQNLGGKNYLQRLQVNGSQDTSYPDGVGFNQAIMSMKLMSNGKLIVAGVFTTFNNLAVKGIIRLTTLGTKDTLFNGVNQGFINGSSYPRTIDLQSNGNIVIGGDFTMYNNTSCGNIIILSPTGAVVTTPTDLDGSPTGNYNVTKVLVDSSDRIYATGRFDTYGGGPSCHKIIRLTSAGIYDSTFAVTTQGLNNGTNAGTSNDYTGGYDMVINNDGNLVVVGDFGTLQGTSVSNIGVLDSTGNISPSNELTTTMIGGKITTILNLGTKYIIGGQFSSYTTPKSGIDTNIGIKFTGIDQYNSDTWETFNGSSWITSTSITTSMPGSINNTFNIQSGYVNKFRVKGTNPDDNQDYHTNELVYTPIVPTVSTYPLVTISGQVWFSKNLDVTKYRNGDTIPQATSQAQVISYANSSTGCWSYSEFNSANASYGRLYNWYAVNDPRGLAPDGYHVPTLDEWTTLTNYVGGPAFAGGELKETGTTHWVSPNLNATDTYGFTVLPAGKNIEAGGMIYPPSNKGRWGYFWVSDVFSATHAKLVFFRWDSASIYLTTNEDKGTNQSVRLIKD